MGFGIFKSNPKPPEPSEWRRAVYLGDIKAIKSLLDRGADINQKILHGFTALQTAATLNMPDVMKVLLDKGAAIDDNVRDFVERSTFWEVKRVFRTEMERRAKEDSLSRKALPETFEKDDALSALIRTGDCTKVRALFDKTFWEGKRIVPGWQHLKIALLREDKPMLKLLATWGGRTLDSDVQLTGLTPAKYTDYARILHECGLDAEPFELAAQIKTATKGAKIDFNQLKPGDLMPDGSIYLGLHNQQDWFVVAEDARDDKGKKLLMDFNAASKYAKNLRIHGHEDWVLPPGYSDSKEPNILREMFNQRNAGAFKGTYNETGHDKEGWYWSSSKIGDLFSSGAWEQRFSDGSNGWHRGNLSISVRCVRAIPRVSGPSGPQ